MSNGLLRGLAARALGLEAPLRSQRASGLDRRPDPPELANDVAPLGAPAPSSANPDVQRHAAGSPSERAVDRPEVPASGSPRATVPVVRPGPAEVPAPRPGTDQPNVAVHRHIPVPAERPGTGAMGATVTGTTPRPEAPALPASTAVEVPTMQTGPIPTPIPLLPLTVAPALPQPVTPSVAATPRRGLSQQTGSAEAPTEVHISIGRVELTALAPNSSGRATPRREAPAGRSLADYLRGAGPGGRKPT